MGMKMSPLIDFLNNSGKINEANRAGLAHCAGRDNPGFTGMEGAALFGEICSGRDVIARRFT